VGSTTLVYKFSKDPNLPQPTYYVPLPSKQRAATMRGRRILKAIRRGVAAGVMGHGKSPQHFAELTDPRLERIKELLLQEILFIAIAAVLYGAETWNDIDFYGRPTGVG
jgi:hypothetical protein